MKKIISIILAFVMMAAVAVPVSADEGEPSYYRYPFVIADDGGSYLMDADFMIPADGSTLYINAEDLAYLSGKYDFDLTYKQCAFVDAETQHAVIFEFDSVTVTSYILGSYSYFVMPEKPVYDGRVAWVPFDYAAQMLNCDYRFYANGSVEFMQTRMNALTALSALMNEENALAFDWCDEVGYTWYNNLIMSASAKTVNFFQGMFTGDTWSAMLTSVMTGTDLFSEQLSDNVADMFVTASESELKVTSAISEAVKMPEEVVKLSDIYVMKDLDANKIVTFLYLNGEISAEAIPSTLENVKNSVEQAKGVFQKVKGGAECAKWLGKFCKLVSCAHQYANTDQVSASALMRYSKKTSFEYGRHMYGYAENCLGGAGKAVLGALDEFMVDVATDALVDVGGSMISGALGKANLLSFGWKLASSQVPFLKNTFDSTKSFAVSEVAVEFQNDAYSIMQDSMDACFYPGGIATGNVDGVFLDAYTYLKFSLVARGAAALTINNSATLEDYVKAEVVGRMSDMDDKTAYYLNYIMRRNYGTLLHGASVDDAEILKTVAEDGTPISAPQMDTPPILDPGQEVGAITPDEAIERVKGAMNKLMSGVGCVSVSADLYEYEYVDNYLADGLVPSYIIMASLPGTDIGYFAVPYHGKEVWLANKNEYGEYECETSVDMSNFSLMTIIEAIMKEMLG